MCVEFAVNTRLYSTDKYVQHGRLTDIIIKTKAHFTYVCLYVRLFLFFVRSS